MPLETPVAMFVFNRPEVTARVFAVVAAQRPTQLLIVGDGPRDNHPGEAECVERTREIVQRVTWDCDLRTDFSSVNLGCKRRVVSGLRWVFGAVPEAIVLEDDCLPEPTFFDYCQQLLRRYRDEERVVAVTGDNFQGGCSRTPYSYYFSKYFHCWGWASWRRVWQHYDERLSTWPEFRNSPQWRTCCDSPAEARYWTHVFDGMYANRWDTWDYAWLYTCWRLQGLTVVPNVNLVRNLGFGAASTHTHDPQSPWANLNTSPLHEVRHPPQIVRHREADAFTFSEHFQPGSGGRRWGRQIRRFWGRVVGTLLPTGRQGADDPQEAPACRRAG